MHNWFGLIDAWKPSLMVNQRLVASFTVTLFQGSYTDWFVLLRRRSVVPKDDSGVEAS